MSNFIVAGNKDAKNAALVFCIVTFTWSTLTVVVTFGSVRFKSCSAEVSDAFIAADTSDCILGTSSSIFDKSSILKLRVVLTVT